jgi:hypothetical protein
VTWLTEGHLPRDVGGLPRRKTSREHIDQTLLPVESWHVPLPFTRVPPDSGRDRIAFSGSCTVFEVHDELRLTGDT